MQVIVRMLRGPSRVFSCKCQDTVQSLHDRIGEPEPFALFYSGQTLNDCDKRLADYGVVDGSTLSMVKREKPGLHVYRACSNCECSEHFIYDAEYMGYGLFKIENACTETGEYVQSCAAEDLCNACNMFTKRTIFLGFFECNMKITGNCTSPLVVSGQWNRIPLNIRVGVSDTANFVVETKNLNY